MRSRLPLLLLLSLLGPIAPVAAEGEVSGSATLAISPTTARAGRTIALNGALEVAEPCLAGRAVVIEHLPATGAGWGSVAATATSADGSFRQTVLAQENGSFRARITAEERDGVACAEVVSPSVGVAVRAFVTARFPRPRLGAGGCAPLAIEVLPPKPGQAVAVELRSGGSWTPLATLTLDDASTASFPRCHGWRSIGETFELRATWQQQDLAHVAGASSAAVLKVVKASWMRRLDRLTDGTSVSISVRDAGSFLYRRRDTLGRIPASNQKLLMSMALLDRLDPNTRLPTTAFAGAVGNGGTVAGDLWIVGSGDPTVGRREIDRLARRIRDAGVTRIRGSVRGATRPFARDWFAPGWRADFPSREIALPTALTYELNEVRGRHVDDPERRAARRLTRRLEALGVRVGGRAGAGTPPSGLVRVAGIRGPTVATVLRPVNTGSWNFGAEVLGKRLGQERAGAPGTIAKGATATEAWASAAGVGVDANDASGLSYRNRVTAAGVARLLGVAEDTPWGPALRTTLASPGSGTLRERLGGVRVRAKTGTLRGVSALSGWVWLERRGAWGEFSIISSGLSKARAVAIEDAAVRLLAARGR